MISLSDELALMTRLALEAAVQVVEIYGRNFTVDFKGPDDPVTEADRAANECICRGLRAARPGAGIVAEESAPASYADFREAEQVYFVDPIDGTKEFVSRNGEFAIMLGLVDGERAVAGVIYAPATGTLWRGAVGLGADRSVRGGAATPLSVTHTSTLAAASVVTSRSHRSAGLDRALEWLAPGRRSVLGSAGLKGAAVAEGAFDLWLAPGLSGWRWDACACDAIITAAGGRLTDASGSAIDYRDPDLSNRRGIVASNGALHDAVIEGLAALRNQDAP